jgi:hypothetical protein
VDLFDEEKPAHSRDCLEEAIRLFVLQELAMLASIGWSLRLKDGAAVRFCLNAEVVDEEGNNLQSIVINRDTLKFLPDYWEDWEEGCFPWK